MTSSDFLSSLSPNPKIIEFANVRKRNLRFIIYLCFIMLFFAMQVTKTILAVISVCFQTQHEITSGHGAA